MQEEFPSTDKPISIANASKLKVSTSFGGNLPEEIPKSIVGARSTDSARVMKFTKVLSETVVILGILTFHVCIFFCASFVDFFLISRTWLQPVRGS